MTAALLLAVYATLAASGLPRLLNDAAWSSRSPRLAILLWQALTASVIATTVLAGVSLAMSSLRLGGEAGQVLHDCAVLIREQYGAGAGGSAAAAGLLFAACVITRLLWTVTLELVSDIRGRRWHLDKLMLVAFPVDGYETVIVDHPQPAAYCIPGRRHCIVLTSAALRSLRPDELDAVLAHERAHVQGRHHIVLVGARAAASAFPRVPLFRMAGREITRLVELCADDVAARLTHRSTVAAALLRVGAGRAPAAGLAASGGAVSARVQRLMAPGVPLDVTGRLMVSLLAALALVGPFVLALWPILGVVTGLYGHICPLTWR